MIEIPRIDLNKIHQAILNISKGTDEESLEDCIYVFISLKNRMLIGAGGKTEGAKYYAKIKNGSIEPVAENKFYIEDDCGDLALINAPSDQSGWLMGATWIISKHTPDDFIIVANAVSRKSIMIAPELTEPKIME